MPADAHAFFALEATDDPLRWRLPVVTQLSTPGRFLFGGCGLAAGIEILETVTGRPLVWATAQYLSFAPIGSVVEYEAVIAVQGHQVSQARAIGSVDGKEILTVNAALGRRALEAAGQWVQMPEVPGPEASPGRVMPAFFAGTILERISTRVAAGRTLGQLDGTPGDARAALWARIEDMPETSSSLLGIFGDFVPQGVSAAFGRPGGGTSLDNTLRVAQIVPTEWVLVDVRLEAVRNGFAHGMAHLWAEDGTLLATASQSIVARFWDPEGPVVTPAG